MAGPATNARDMYLQCHDKRTNLARHQPHSLLIGNCQPADFAKRQQGRNGRGQHFPSHAGSSDLQQKFGARLRKILAFPLQSIRPSCRICLDRSKGKVLEQSSLLSRAALLRHFVVAHPLATQRQSRLRATQEAPQTTNMSCRLCQQPVCHRAGAHGTALALRVLKLP